MLDLFWKEITLTLRTLWKRPSYTIVVVVTLAIGFGACTAVFSVVHSVLLRPLPFHSPDRLALIPSLNRDGFGKMEQYGSSLNDFMDWRERNRSFTALAAMQPTEVAITGIGDAEQIEAGLISANLFDTLGVRPYAGRFFSTKDEIANANVVILSHGLWRNRFGGSTNALGQAIVVDGSARQIIGIAPRDFFFAANAELWLPLNLSTPRNARTPGRNLAVTGRVRDNVTIDQASNEIKVIAAQLAREFQGNAGWGAKALPIREPYVREVRSILYFLLAAVSFLLLIVCVNVANLVLVRHMERKEEMVLRLALGGSRIKLLRQGFLENILLTIFGGSLGLFLSALALKPMIALSPLIGSSPSGNRILNSVTLDLRVVLFALSVSLITGVVLSILPILRISRLNLFEILKSSARRSVGTIHERRFQKVFVIAQLAISFLLLIGAALMLQSFERLKSIDPGFKTESLLTARLTLPESRYGSHEKRAQFQQQILENIKTIPGVIAASATTRLPLNEFAMTTLFEVDGVPTPDGGHVANFRRIGPSYFQTLMTPVLLGREFTKKDPDSNMPVAIVSREMAKQFWPGQSAIGKRVRRLSQTDKMWRTIVGIVEDVKDSSLSAPPGMTFYIPYMQSSIPSFHLVIRSADPSRIIAPVREKVRELDPDLPLYQAATAQELFMDSLSRTRFSAYLLAIFALLGMFIAVIGVYGVVSYSTTRRVNEIGVRMAVGAPQRSILVLILKQSLRFSLWGILIGLIASIYMERTITSMWSASGGLEAYVATSAVVAFTALVASFIPALRATRIDPVTALRYE